MNVKFWGFISILFALYGFIILAAGIYYWAKETKTYATQFHPSIWWGLIMLLGALVFYLISKKAERPENK